MLEKFRFVETFNNGCMIFGWTVAKTSCDVLDYV